MPLRPRGAARRNIRRGMEHLTLGWKRYEDDDSTTRREESTLPIFVLSLHTRKPRVHPLVKFTWFIFSVVSGVIPPSLSPSIHAHTRPPLHPRPPPPVSLLPMVYPSSGIFMGDNPPTRGFRRWHLFYPSHERRFMLSRVLPLLIRGGTRLQQRDMAMDVYIYIYVYIEWKERCWVITEWHVNDFLSRRFSSASCTDNNNNRLLIVDRRKWMDGWMDGRSLESLPIFWGRSIDLVTGDVLYIGDLLSI